MQIESALIFLGRVRNITSRAPAQQVVLEKGLIVIDSAMDLLQLSSWPWLWLVVGKCHVLVIHWLANVTTGKALEGSAACRKRQRTNLQLKIERCAF
jgi:hypothetical protein